MKVSVLFTLDKTGPAAKAAYKRCVGSTSGCGHHVPAVTLGHVWSCLSTSEDMDIDWIRVQRAYTYVSCNWNDHIANVRQTCFFYHSCGCFPWNGEICSCTGTMSTNVWTFLNHCSKWFWSYACHRSNTSNLPIARKKTTDTSATTKKRTQRGQKCGKANSVTATRSPTYTVQDYPTRWALQHLFLTRNAFSIEVHPATCT